jgi:hypothetical protein
MITDGHLLDLIGPKRGPRMTLGTLIAMARHARQSVQRTPRSFLKQGETIPVMAKPVRRPDGVMLLPVPRGIARQLASRG